MDEANAIRRAENEVLLRRYNEHVEAERLLTQPTLSEWVCECADEKCIQPVTLTIAEYEAVRAEPTHYGASPTSTWLRRSNMSFAASGASGSSQKPAWVQKSVDANRNVVERNSDGAGHGAPAIHVRMLRALRANSAYRVSSQSR